jgi:TRAP transporter TAXI family solute receptor
MHLMKTYLPALLLVLAGFVVAWRFVQPAPPRSITIATGAPNGAYTLFAGRYRALLAENGITLQIRETAGTVENLALLQAGQVDLAFVQGGVAGAGTGAGLESLGSLYYEPLWLFYRRPAHADRLTDFRGLRLATGQPGSGTHALVQTLLEDNHLEADTDHLLPLGGDEALGALTEGRVDAAMFVAAPSAPLIRTLLHRQDIRLMSFARAAAYTRIHHALATLTLPEGTIDLQADIPPHATTLLAATANLVAREDFHPALVSLLLQAATRVHGAGGLFEQPGEFPSASNVDFPLNPHAQHYYRYGQPFLQRYLPFWTANLIDRLKIMLLPLITLLVPMFKLMPPVFRWQVRRKIYRWYRELQALDAQTPAETPAARFREMLQQLDAIEEEVRQVRVPLSYRDELYNLRLHIDLVRQRLQATRE